MTLDLFQAQEFSQESEEHVELFDGGTLDLYRRFISKSESVEFFDILKKELKWTASKVVVFGKEHTIPRLNAWYGEQGAAMTYSNAHFDPLPFTPLLQTLRERLETKTNAKYNSVLANLYRSGDDKMGTHSDDEKEFRQNPTIASLSFGATRKFVLKHKKRAHKVELMLGDGDLLIMRDTCQHFYKHALPQMKRVKAARINLTFRRVYTS